MCMTGTLAQLKREQKRREQDEKRRKREEELQAKEREREIKASATAVRYWSCCVCVPCTVSDVYGQHQQLLSGC